MINLNFGIVHGFFQKRINRFLAQVELGVDSVLAHVPNPGRMHELFIPRKEVFLRVNPGSQRKTDFDLIAVKHNQLIISIDLNLPNQFIRRLLQKHELPMFSEYDQVIPEPRVYDSRFNFQLIGNSGNQFIEVKSCTLVESGRALFPDAPTLRGAKHVRYLVKAMKENLAFKTAIIFVVQRPDATVFSPNEITDPNFAQALRFANE